MLACLTIFNNILEKETFFENKNYMSFEIKLAESTSMCGRLR